MALLSKNGTFIEIWQFDPKMAHLSKNGTFIPKWHIYPKMAHLFKNCKFILKLHISHLSINSIFIQATQKSAPPKEYFNSLLSTHETLFFRGWGMMEGQKSSKRHRTEAVAKRNVKFFFFASFQFSHPISILKLAWFQSS